MLLPNLSQFGSRLLAPQLPQAFFLPFDFVLPHHFLDARASLVSTPVSSFGRSMTLSDFHSGGVSGPSRSVPWSYDVISDLPTPHLSNTGVSAALCMFDAEECNWQLHLPKALSAYSFSHPKSSALQHTCNAVHLCRYTISKWSKAVMQITMLTILSSTWSFFHGFHAVVSKFSNWLKECLTSFVHKLWNGKCVKSKSAGWGLLIWCEMQSRVSGQGGRGGR